jgi:hypothetical protein
MIPILNNHVFTASSARVEEANNNWFVLDTVAGITHRLNVSVGTDIDFELVG